MATVQYWAAAVGDLPRHLAGFGGLRRAPTELVVYSSRNEQLIKPMFDRYTAETGQAINFVTDDAGPLIERLAVEGANSTGRLADHGRCRRSVARGRASACCSRWTRRFCRRTFPTTCAIRRESLVRAVRSRAHDRLQH